MILGLVSATYALSTRVAPNTLPTEGVGMSVGEVTSAGMPQLYVALHGSCSRALLAPHLDHGSLNRSAVSALSHSSTPLGSKDRPTYP